MHFNKSSKRLLKKRIEEAIVKTLKKHKELSKSMIARLCGISPATASKYVDILEAKGVVEVRDYGNVNVVRLREK